MLSNKKDFNKFMADDDISGYVANFKSILRGIDSLKVNIKDSKDISEKDFSSIKDFGLSLVEHSNSDEIRSLYKIDKSYVYSMISALDAHLSQYNSTRVREGSIVMQSTFPIFWKLHELAEGKEKKQVLFIYDIILESGFDSYPDLNINDYPNSHCKRIARWKNKALSKIK